MQNFARLFGSI